MHDKHTQFHHLLYRHHNDDWSLLAHLHLGCARYGLTGANGSGKSTLLRLVAGQLHSTSGQIDYQGRIVYLAQHPGDSVFDVLPPEFLEDDWHLPELLGRLQWLPPGHVGKPPTAATLLQWIHNNEARLSGGERQRLRLSLCFALNPDILLLDEPGNDLDAEGLLWLQQRLRHFDGLLIVASHQAALLAVMEQILWLHEAELQLYRGSYSELLQWQQQHRDAARRTYANSQKTLQQRHRQTQENKEKAQRRARTGKRERKRNSQNKALLDFQADRAGRSRGADVRQCQRQQEQATMQLKTDQNRWRHWQDEDIQWPQISCPLTPGVLIQASGLRLPFVPAEVISLQVHQQDHWHIRGRNGCGKSTLLRVLSGDLAEVPGTLVRRGAVIRLEQQTLQPDSDCTALDWLQKQCPTIEPKTLRHWLALAGLSSALHVRPVSQLSGGERMKIAILALWGLHPGALLLLDEPDNHLDQTAAVALQQALRQWPGAWLLVSHNDEFAAACGVTHTLQLGDDQCMY